MFKCRTSTCTIVNYVMWRSSSYISRNDFHGAYNCHVSYLLYPYYKIYNSDRVKCHKILIDLPSPIRRHYHPKYTFTTLALVSYLRSLVVRALHRHRKGVGSIPAGGPIVDEFFLNCSWLEFDMCMISTRN